MHDVHAPRPVTTPRPPTPYTCASAPRRPAALRLPPELPASFLMHFLADYFAAPNLVTALELTLSLCSVGEGWGAAQAPLNTPYTLTPGF